MQPYCLDFKEPAITILFLIKQPNIYTMSMNTILKTAACFMMALPVFGNAVAQQAGRSMTNQLFIQLPNPQTEPVAQSMQTASTNSTVLSHAVNRTLDGTNNNIGSQRTQYGAANIQLYRELPPVYGPSDTRNA